MKYQFSNICKSGSAELRFLKEKKHNKVGPTTAPVNGQREF